MRGGSLVRVPAWVSVFLRMQDVMSRCGLPLRRDSGEEVMGCEATASGGLTRPGAPAHMLTKWVRACPVGNPERKQRYVPFRMWVTGAQRPC